MEQDRRSEIAASVAAHGDLGPGYDSAVAEGLIERIGDEIDRRVDARLGRREREREPEPAPARQPKAPGSVASTFMTLGSIALGVGATAVATSLGKNAAAQVVMVLLIWAAIAAVNFSHSRRRG
jgi:hypothetical protein